MQNFVIYSGYVMGVLFVVMGLGLALGLVNVDSTGVPWRLFGVALIAYGGFRLYRSWRLQQVVRQRREQEEEPTSTDEQ